jgi:hypothetical protein
MAWPGAPRARSAGARLLGEAQREDDPVWCRACAAEIDVGDDYQPWVVANFSASCATSAAELAVRHDDVVLWLRFSELAAAHVPRVAGFSCPAGRAGLINVMQQQATN